jgi:chromosome segregation ATPase
MTDQREALQTEGTDAAVDATFEQRNKGRATIDEVKHNFEAVYMENQRLRESNAEIGRDRDFVMQKNDSLLNELHALRTELADITELRRELDGDGIRETIVRLNNKVIERDRTNEALIKQVCELGQLVDSMREVIRGQQRKCDKQTVELRKSHEEIEKHKEYETGLEREVARLQRTLLLVPDRKSATRPPTGLMERVRALEDGHNGIVDRVASMEKRMNAFQSVNAEDHRNLARDIGALDKIVQPMRGK